MAERLGIRLSCMSFPYILLVIGEAIAVLAYGWTVGRGDSRLNLVTAFGGAIALALALSLVSTMMLLRLDVPGLPIRYLLTVYAWSFLLPVFAVTGTALLLRPTALPAMARVIVLVLVLGIAGIVGQRYAARHDVIQATA